MIFETVYLVLLFFATYFIMFHINLWFEYKNDILMKKDSGYFKRKPSVSLIIPAYNEEGIIKETLEKVKDIDYPRSKFEVIVVDDGSTDKTYEIAKKFRSRWIRVFTKKNGGKGSALNFGVNKAKNEFIAVMDADSYLEKDALKNCMHYFDSKKVAAVTSHILCSKKRTFWERMQEIELMLIAVTRKMEEYANVIQATPGPLSIYRKSILKKLGGFDEENLVEDIEIAWNILKNGYKIRMALDAVVYSIFPSSFKSWWKQRLRWQIGGAQVLSKYWSSLGRNSHAVGSFLIPTYIFGYIATIVGMGMFIYLAAIRIFNYIVFSYKLFSFDINPLSKLNFYLIPDLNIILGFTVFVLVIYLIKISYSVHKWRIGMLDFLLDLPLFIFIYPILLPIVTIVGVCKYYKGEREWLTK